MRRVLKTVTIDDEIDRMKTPNEIRENLIKSFISLLEREFYDRIKSDLRFALSSTKPIIFTTQDAYKMISG
jgi:hypothetical protein